MKQFSLKLKRKYEIADQTMAFSFEKPSDFVFSAGQYVVMTIPNLLFPDARMGKRSLSIASAPYEDELLFAMRITESGFKKTLAAMNEGDEVLVTQPLGHFVLDATDRPIVFLVGGIGVTPARSILRQAAHEHSSRSFTVFYSNRRSDDVAFRGEMQRIDGLENYRCIDTLTNEMAAEMCEWQEESGFVCENMLTKYLQDAKSPWYYVVGSSAFAQAMVAMLSTMGIAKDSIKQDPFTGI